MSMPRPRAFFVAAAFLFVTLLTFYSFRQPVPFPRSHDTFDIELDVIADLPQQPSKSRGFHLLTTATGNDLNVCRLVLSAAILSYPPTVLLSWHGEGEYNAAESHLAKVLAPLRYFDTLPASSDDDLVLLVDGYDVIFQLGPDVLLKRYSETIAASNRRLEQKWGKDHLQKHNMYTTTLYGPDVLCYPIDFRRPACWLVPESTLPRDAFGPETDKNDEHTRPRWLNSGTVLGPVRDIRALFQATMEKVNKTWDPNFYGRNSDQMYIANVWADQEYARMTSSGDKATFPLPDAVPEDVKPNIITPEVEDRKAAEVHVGIDYESRMFQTVALFYDILKWETFSAPRRFTNPHRPGDGEFDVALPDVVRQSKAPYRALSGWTWGSAWLRRRSWTDVPLGINVVTRNFMPVIHFTGLKHYRDMWWEKLWFFEDAEKLLKARPDRGVIAVIDGVEYKPYLPYGKDSRREDAWADQGELLKWEGLCGEHEKALFGRYVPPPPPPEEEKKQDEQKDGEKKEEGKQ